MFLGISIAPHPFNSFFNHLPFHRMWRLRIFYVLLIILWWKLELVSYQQQGLLLWQLWIIILWIIHQLLRIAYSFQYSKMCRYSHHILGTLGVDHNRLMYLYLAVHKGQECNVSRLGLWINEQRVNLDLPRWRKPILWRTRNTHQLIFVCLSFNSMIMIDYKKYNNWKRKNVNHLGILIDFLRSVSLIWRTTVWLSGFRMAAISFSLWILCRSILKQFSQRS